MSIKESLEKINPFYTLILCLVIASIFFALGRLSAIENRHYPIKIEYKDEKQEALVVDSISKENSVLSIPSGEVVGSKSGKKYYYPWCSTVKRIKPENQVHFSSIDEAKKAGFTAGGNCKGLK